MKKTVRFLIMALVLSILMTTAASPVALAGPCKAELLDVPFECKKDFMAALPEQYMKDNPNVEIEFVVIPRRRVHELQADHRLRGGRGGRVLHEPGRLPEVREQRFGDGPDALLPSELLDDFLPSSIEAVTVDGKICAIRLRSSCWACTTTRTCCPPRASSRPPPGTS